MKIISRRKTKRNHRPSLLFAGEFAIFIAVLLIFALKMTNYFGIESLKPEYVTKPITTFISREWEYITQSKHLGKCPNDLLKIENGRSYVCRNDVKIDEYVKIFDGYEKIADGREYIYGEAIRGDVDAAKLLIESDKYDFGRNEPVLIKNPKWTEDPFKDRYWRFNYYGLSAIDNLVTAYEDTGDVRYAQKANGIVSSFYETGQGSKHAWDDTHAVSFRTMTLINYWWKLRQGDVLDIEASNKTLLLLQRHAEFLMDRNNFEAAQNHGVNEAAALLLLAHTFPTLDNADVWKSTAYQRLSDTLETLIDKDGVLIENSPFYHFYVLRKYWNIYTYTQRQDIPAPVQLKDRLDKMVKYASHILQPDLNVPTIGASLKAEIFYNAEYKEIAHEYPEFKYVLTKGVYGKKPSERNVYFKTAGEAIQRSSFEGSFDKHAQAVLHAADYRSDHSHLDALSVTLTKGRYELLIDPGLYAYEKYPLTDYFQGTLGHNSVTVDDKDQHKGEASLTSSSETEDYSTSSASHNLYAGVNHTRSMSLLGDHTLVIYDTLLSESEHKYTQMFHFAANSTAQKQGDSSVVVTSSDGKETFKVRQLQPVDSAEVVVSRVRPPPGGYCSEQYNRLLTCPQANFYKKGTNVTFTTVIEINDLDQKYSLDGNKIKLLTSDKREYDMSFSYLEGSGPRLSPAVTQQYDNPSPKPHVGIVIDNASPTMDYVRPILENYKYKAIVSLPTRELIEHSYTMTTPELKRLDEIYGWDIVNQGSEQHVQNTELLKLGQVDEYEQGIIRGAIDYSKLGIDVNPLWYMHNERTYSGDAAKVYSKYYPLGFSLDTIAPVGTDARNARIMSLNVGNGTPIETIRSAIDEAFEKKQIIFLIFDRFKKDTMQLEGYPTHDFEGVLAYIESKGLAVSGLDDISQELGVRSVKQPVIQPAQASDIQTKIQMHSNKKFYEFWH